MASNLHASLLPIKEKEVRGAIFFVAEKRLNFRSKSLFEQCKSRSVSERRKTLNFAPKPSLRFSTQLRSQSLRGYFAVTSRSQHGHYAVTSVTTRSLRGHNGHYAVTAVTT